MKLTEIKTNRNIKTRPSWDLVYEWEDIIKEYFNLNFRYTNKINHLLNKIIRIIPFNPVAPIYKKNNLTLIFQMNANTKQDLFNRNDIIPIIIDFYLCENELSDFYKVYDKNLFIIITSAEVFTFLNKKKCPLKIFHLPLSISDKYRIKLDTKFKKKWDLVLAGRLNPVLEGWLKKYIKKNPTFKYVYKKRTMGKVLYYTNDGELLGEFGNRQAYMTLLSQSKIGFYATPGIDGGEIRTRGYNQVTPRFLELVVSGCHIIARYPKNADTEYYQIADFTPNTDSYDLFEEQMGSYLKKDIPIEKYVNYMELHYTSIRAKSLNEIIKKNK